MASKFSTINKQTILYGVSLAALVLLMKWLEVKVMIIDNAMEVYVGAIAVIFTTLGIWLALKLTKPKTKTVIIEKEVFVAPPQNGGEGFSINDKALYKSGISARELEVLQLMAEGLSNQEIAARLYVSQNTIKTHSSNLFLKLDVRRRTQAVDVARKLGLVP